MSNPLVGKFKQQSCMILAGPSKCGKTTWVCNLLRRPQMFDHVPRRVVWCSKTANDSLKLDVRRIVNNFSGTSLFLNHFPEHKGSGDTDPQIHDVWVIDDLGSELKKSTHLTEFFTLGAHHNNCFLIYLTQDYFMKSPENTTRNKNAQYLVAFRDRQNVQGIDMMGMKRYPRHPTTLTKMFSDATKNKMHSHI